MHSRKDAERAKLKSPRPLHLCVEHACQFVWSGKADARVTTFHLLSACNVTFVTLQKISADCDAYTAIGRLAMSGQGSQIRSNIASRNFTRAWLFIHHQRRLDMGRTVGISVGGLILLLIVVAFVF